MPRVSVNVGNGFYQSNSLPLSNQRCVNLYPNLPQSQAISQDSLFGTPGIRYITDTGIPSVHTNRGAWVKDGVPYFVNGTRLFRLDRTVTFGEEVLTEAFLGVIEGSNRCHFADNGKQLMILVPGTPSKGYIVDETQFPVVQEITDADFYAHGNPQAVVFIDSFFVATTDEKRIIQSASGDGTSWNSLDFGAAVVDPDDIVAPFVFRNQIFVGGKETFEVFENIGVAGFTFRRINGLVYDVGLASQYAIASDNNAFYWLGAEKSSDVGIWASNGSGAQKISTVAIDAIIARLNPDELPNAFAWSYGQDGNYFIGFTFQSLTIVYDSVTGRWHERESRFTNELGVDVVTRCRYNSVVQAYGRIFVGDSVSGRIGQLDREYYKEYTEPFTATFSLAPFYNQGTSFSITQAELFMESGVGNDDKPDPEVRLRMSKDGKVYNFSLSRKVGKEGEYSKRQIWRQLGRFSRMAVAEISMSDPVKRAFYTFEANVKGGRQLGN